MNNREKIQNKIETGNFMHINGSILRTLNVISDSKCRLSSLEYSFKGVDHYCFMDSIKYLDTSGYVELTDSENGKKTDFKANRFNFTYSKGYTGTQGSDYRQLYRCLKVHYGKEKKKALCY